MSAISRKVDDGDIVTITRPSALDVFRERCEARAILVEACVYDLQEAVDGLQQAAVETGLVADIGQDAVQKMMADAFAIVPKISRGYNVTSTTADKTRPKGAAISTLRTAEYLVQQNDPMRLKAWLAKHTASECAAILHHIERKKR